MKSFFENTVLVNHGLKYHDHRSLWKYELSETDFMHLKVHLQKLTAYEIDPRDVALYFAEWWKNVYDGGTPSIQAVYNSLQPLIIDRNYFYNRAKRGVRLLGVKWMQNSNKLYFRTLLSQGGLPITHVLQNSGAYTNFLKKIIELNPSSIDEFAFDDELTRLLPFSSRNDSVYDSCLQIVEAVWNGDEEYLKIYENRRNSNSTFKKLKDELINHKNQVKTSVKRRVVFRAFWVLRKNENKYDVQLEFSFPKLIEKEKFIELLNIDLEETSLKSEYHLIINEINICKYKKNLSGNYKLIWYSSPAIYWKNEDVKPDVYLSSSDGEKLDFSVVNIDLIKLPEPSMWTERSENEWLYRKGKNCTQEEALIIYGKDWHATEECLASETVMINDTEYQFCKFKGETEFEKDNERLVFKTSATSFDWYVAEHKPDWIMKSNVPVVRGRPDIIAYDKSGNRLKVELFWRIYAYGPVWNDWKKNNLAAGLIEYKIKYKDCEETGFFYNIGNLQFEFSSGSVDSASVKINDPSFHLNIKETEKIDLQKENTNEYFLELIDLERMPNSVKASVRYQKQNRSLLLEIVPPFNGVKIVDAEGFILKDKSDILLGNFTGFRIYAPKTSGDIFIKIYNSDKPRINLTKQLKQNIIPLREFEDIIIKFFRLNDSMQLHSSVTLDFCNSKGKLLSTYYVKNYTHAIEPEYGSGRLELISKIDDEVDLFAVPLNCHSENIDLIALENEEEITYLLPKDTNEAIENFIIISRDENNLFKLLPCLAFSNKEIRENSKLPNKEIRLNNSRKRLETCGINDNQWQKLLKYYHICINNEIPFTTFDVFRAAAATPELVAKLFCFLALNNSLDNFIEEICPDIEDDLGICFHWISQKHWINAIQWVNNNNNELVTNVIFDDLFRKINILINSSEDPYWFSKIKNFIINNNLENIKNFVPRSEIRILRQRLGEKVLNGLPGHNCPRIPAQFKKHLPVDTQNAIVKILLKAPLAVALSLSGENKDVIWGNKSSDEIRRNIQYAQWIAPKWYAKAILYCLNRIKNNN